VRASWLRRDGSMLFSMFAAAVAAALTGCATTATSPYLEPSGPLWGYTEDSLVRSDIGRSVIVTKSKEQCERNLTATRSRPNAENLARLSECRQVAFGTGDAYWVFTFPPHILIATAWGSVNQETCEKSRQVLSAQSGAAASPCTLTSIQLK
jgi:hypothetical protein